MTEKRDWQFNRDMWVRILKQQTREGVEWWNQRIQDEGLGDEPSLRAWLNAQGVTGYAQGVLIMEIFGYPAHFLASADQLIEAQYADRPDLRPIFDCIVGAVTGLGEIILQARKTYVSFRTPRRTFARVQPTTKTRVDLALRLEGHALGGRLQRSRIHETTPLQVGLTSPEEVDEEVLDWLRQAYDENN
jgi:hypothetical protein